MQQRTEDNRRKKRPLVSFVIIAKILAKPCRFAELQPCRNGDAASGNVFGIDIRQRRILSFAKKSYL